MHPKRVLQLQLAVEEAVMNTCSYAYQVPPGEIVVRVHSEKDRFAVELIDEGIPFDPLAAEEPDTKASLEERGIGGLGILLIRRTMDEVHYRREDNHNFSNYTGISRYTRLSHTRSCAGRTNHGCDPDSGTGIHTFAR